MDQTDLDIEIKKWIEDDFEITIRQDADTVGTDAPAYYYLIHNLRVKNAWGEAVSGWSTVEAAEEAIRTALPGKKVRRAKREAREARKSQPPPPSKSS